MKSLKVNSNSKTVTVESKSMKYNITKEMLADIGSYFNIDAEKELEKILSIEAKRFKREERLKKLKEINKK